MSYTHGSVELTRWDAGDLIDCLLERGRWGGEVDVDRVCLAGVFDVDWAEREIECGQSSTHRIQSAYLLWAFEGEREELKQGRMISWSRKQFDDAARALVADEINLHHGVPCTVHALLYFIYNNMNQLSHWLFDLTSATISSRISDGSLNRKSGTCSGMIFLAQATLSSQWSANLRIFC